MDYYQILGVKRDATKQEIKEAFKKKAMQFHPDKHTKASNSVKEYYSTKFKHLSGAYEVLSNDSSRVVYDLKYRVAQAQQQRRQQQWGRNNTSSSSSSTTSSTYKSYYNPYGYGGPNQSGAYGYGSSSSSGQYRTTTTSFRERIRHWYKHGGGRTRLIIVGEVVLIGLLILSDFDKDRKKNDTKKNNTKQESETQPEATDQQI